MAAGGIYSCVKDMSIYMLMHLGKGTYKDVKVMSKESSNLMQTNSIKPGTMAHKVLSNYSPQKSMGYGFGFFIDSKFYGFKSVGHGGSWFGGSADFQFIPSLNIGMVALANTLLGPWDVLSSVLAMIAGIPEEKIHLLVERKHFMKLTGIFSGICILISCLGLFGLAAFTTEQRTKEIGIRKILGATTSQIIVMLSRSILLIVLVASVVASLIAYFIIDEWLTDFAYHAGINPLVFVLSAAIAMAVAFGTVALQAFKTAQENPVKALRYE